MSATANTTSAPWTIPNRLRRITWRVARQDDELRSGGNRELEALFGDRCESGATGGDGDRSLERFPLGDELVTLLAKALDHRALLDSITAPRYDACGRQNETSEDQGGDGAAAEHHSALRHARSRALRARGLEADSATDGVIGFRTISPPSGCPRHTQRGRRGGHTQRALQSRNAFFTIRSSPE